MCSVFSLFFDSILDFSWVWGAIRGKVNSAFDRARRVLSWSLLIRFWSPLWANPSGKYANPDPGYPTWNFAREEPTSIKTKMWRKRMFNPVFWKVFSTHALTFIKVTRYTLLSYLPFINHNRIEYNNITKRTLSRKEEYHNKKHNITNRRVSWKAI